MTSRVSQTSASASGSGSQAPPGSNDARLSHPAPNNYREVLTEAQRAALNLDVAWLGFRAEFRKRMVQQGYLKHQWRSVFEADMIFSVVAVRWLASDPITLKELATYFEAFTTMVTVKRHIDDMEAAGTLLRVPDETDKRRLLLVPTSRLAEIGAIFLQARVDIARRQGFIYDPERAAAELGDKL
jgi:hypothetical protein